MENELLDPIELYNKTLKEEHNKNTTDHFQKLVEESKVDVEANRKTVARYKKVCKIIKKSKSKRRSLKVCRVFFYIFSGLVFGVAIMWMIFAICLQNSIPLSLSLGMMFMFIALGAGFILINIFVFTPKIHNWNQKLDALQLEANQLMEEAKLQMKPLNDLYDWNMQTDLVKKTTPLIQLDDIFDTKKQEIFLKRFNYDENNNDNSSVYFAQSGTLNTNPFIFERNFDQNMGQRTYSNSITITYPHRYKDSNGKIQTETRQETLTASVTKPIPTYCYNTYLFYGNDAAPNLYFKRIPTHIKGLNDAQVKQFAKKRIKELRKEAASDLKNSNSHMLTEMGNEEFDALFGAFDRDHEVEFRLLFTPLAQKGMLKVIKQSPFGDDFSFIKSKKLNCLRSTHIETSNIYSNPRYFYNYDIDDAKEKFINYHNQYFQDIFFMMAPILSIPLYEHQEPLDFVYSEEQESNLTDTEHEIMANSFNTGAFNFSPCATNNILKADFIRKAGNYDVVKITSHGFSVTRLSQIIGVKGGDNKTYNIKVFYDEYNPVAHDFTIVLRKFEMRRTDYLNSFASLPFGQRIIQSYANNMDNISFQRGILAFKANENFNEEDAEQLDKLLPQNKA